MTVIPSSNHGRTQFVVVWMGILFVTSWVIAMGRMLDVHFWDPVYAIERQKEMQEKHDFLYNSTVLNEMAESYYTKRYVFFLPHVAFAFIWWNLYFLQLLPSVRKNYPVFHRYLGRLLMVVLFGQVLSGMGLAWTSHSPTIKIVSHFVAFATIYCMFQACYYARSKDFVKHQYWAMRVVGYMQGISLQRFWMVVLILSHQLGWTGLYPSITGKTMEEIDQIVMQLFDDCFVLSVLTAVYFTEWYLAGHQGMLNSPHSSNNTTAKKTPKA